MKATEDEMSVVYIVAMLADLARSNAIPKRLEHVNVFELARRFINRDDAPLSEHEQELLFIALSIAVVESGADANDAVGVILGLLTELRGVTADGTDKRLAAALHAYKT